MVNEHNPDTILQLFITEAELIQAVKSRLFYRLDAIEKLSINDIIEDIGISVQVEAQTEYFERKLDSKPASFKDRVLFFSEATPKKPTVFSNNTQYFPLRDTIRFHICNSCNGTTHITCSNCNGSRTENCSNCSGSGDCSWCHGSGTESCSCFNDDDCPWCGGSGTVRCSHCLNGNCSSCNGSGTQTCTTCSGSGVVICPNCLGEGRQVSFEVDIYTYKHHIQEQSVTGKLPSEIKKKFDVNKKTTGQFFSLETLTTNGIESHLGFITEDMKIRVTDGLTARDGLLSGLKTTKGTILFTKDHFRIVPINHVEIEYPLKKTYEKTTYWTIGASEKPTEQLFKLPLHPGKIFTNIIFQLSLIATLFVFLNNWSTGELYNLTLYSYLKFIPPIISLLMLVLIISFLTKGSYKKIAILGTNNQIKITYFTLSVLFISKTNQGEISDKFLFKKPIEELLLRNYLSPGISLTCTIRPNKFNTKIKRTLKILSLNSKSFCKPKSPTIKKLQRYVKNYIVLIVPNESKETDLVAYNFFSELLNNKKRNLVKISFLLLTTSELKGTILLSTLIPKTYQIIMNNQQKIQHTFEKIELMKFLSQYSEDNIKILELIINPIYRIN
ncbi:MAG: hypothetical protein JXA54_12930 [Candidatus Heimdallarchaeota archaeon]|nr:hypothetical protein [Candidatus Heimdallarchaeota archaeon]